ncbi:Transcriptional regulator, LysR family [Bradyrhizobium sp. STM 3843]|uniref:LysR substrate-binding domain-containing protein n=1 Tax=Bradyrhizobium sp. STM 3843 TaxID=551947 RepID=UPI000240AA90|nr:LysR substrate-binding domain-containing protein [Bradyrhizobium sp. STM 3843]CCE05453.1 Transcriptional regulator, LysR family [Bradyrhizobium sp. STM 3843]
MELIWLEDYLELARTGNFSRAAEARHLTQPAFSRRIRALEEWAGVTLFDRATQPVQLTVAGREFQPLAAMLIRRIADARAHVREVAAAEAATIRIAATHALSLIFFPPWLKRLEAAGLICCVQLTSDTLSAVETLLLDGRAHFLLCHVHDEVPLRLPANEFVSAVVANDRLMPCAAPGLVASGAALSDAPLLAYGAGSGLGRILRSLLGARLPRLLSAPALTADLAGALRALCLDGRGVAWLPATLVEDDLKSGRLVTFADASLEVPVAVRLFRPLMPLTPTAEELWRLAQEQGS